MEASSSGTNHKRPACDNCKDRKTKCDRGSPCSSCVAAELDCQITRRAPEKRQRVLISARYDEAMESVDRSLQEVSQALQKLLANNKQSQDPSKGSPATFNSNNLSNMSEMTEGYRGDSSFKAHVQKVNDALRDTASSLDISMTERSLFATVGTTQMIQEATNSVENTPSAGDKAVSSFKFEYPELERRTLPPLEPVLKLLRFTHIEKQRLFIDVPIIDEHEFGDLCQKVYFALNDYSLSAWTIVNTGLYYLFLGLKEHNHSQIGVTASDIQGSSRLLSDNLEAAIQSLRLCQDPSMEGCQSLALLATFCMKSGRSRLAWSLVSSASRMCIDLGWHRLPREPRTPQVSKEKIIFWHVYIMDKGMAFTLGRTPSIHQYDVATERPAFPQDLPGAPGYLYAGFVEFAVIVGDMHIQLFSAAAQRGPQHTRTESAKAFAARLVQVNSDLKQSSMDGPPLEAMFQDTMTLLDIIMHCLMTIVYRIVPSDEPNSHPLQCNIGCIEAARQALSTIVHGSQTLGERNPVGWSMFLNMLFSLVPFASFVVLAGNTVASSSTEDLTLLFAAVTAIEPIAASSPSGRKLYEICKSFYQTASLSVIRQAELPRVTPASRIGAPQAFGNSVENAFSVQVDASEAHAYDNIMAPQDWDTVMNEFELGIGAGAMASFVEPYMPFDGRFP